MAGEPLAQAAGVSGHSPPALGRVPERVQHQLPLGAGHATVYVPGRHRARWPLRRRQHPQCGRQRAGELAGLDDPGQECHAAVQPELRRGHRQRGLSCGHPHRDTALAGPADQPGQLTVGRGGDHDPVALQPALGDPRPNG
jgi:hypothetical protein